MQFKYLDLCSLRHVSTVDSSDPPSLEAAALSCPWHSGCLETWQLYLQPPPLYLPHMPVCIIRQQNSNLKKSVNISQSSYAW